LNSTLALISGLGLGLETSGLGLGLGLEALGLGLGLEAFGLGLETPGLANIPDCRLKAYFVLTFWAEKSIFPE